MLSLYAVKDGCVHSVASVSKAWRAAWRRRCKGRWRLLRTQIGDFRHAIHVTALATGGAIVADYGHFKLQAFSPDGDSQTIYCERFETPGAIALLGDGTAWMLAQDREAVCLVRWQDDVGALQPSHRWPNGWNHDGNWNDPYGRILQHVDFNALRGLRRNRASTWSLVILLFLVIGYWCSAVVPGSGESACWTVRPESFSIISVRRAKPAKMSFACQGPSRYTRTCASLRIPIITRSKFSTFASGSS